MSFANLQVNYEAPITDDVTSLLQLKSDVGANFVVYPLFHPRLQRGDRAADNRQTAITYSDRLLSSSQWPQHFIAKLNGDLDLDHPDWQRRKQNQCMFLEELHRAAHLGINTVVLPTPRPKHGNYARVLLQYLDEHVDPQSSFTCLISIPLSVPAHLTKLGQTANSFEDSAADASWELWNSFRMACNLNPRVWVCLDVGGNASLPHPSSHPALLERWGAEPVRSLRISTKLFVFNPVGYPVLPKFLQNMVEFFAQRRVHITLTGAAQPPISNNSHSNANPPPPPGLSVPQAAEVPNVIPAPSLGHYVQYLRHLLKRLDQQTTSKTAFIRPFFDVLQSPLQPLKDHLAGVTYEVFEQDEIKYIKYREAIAKAIWDVCQAQSTAEPCVVRVAVLGAGRGPLIAASLAALQDVNQQRGAAAALAVHVLGVEKNPNAVITLRNRHASEQWGERVQLLAGDMRSVRLPHPVHIIVSELLGSWGDNELSPECLEGAYDRHAELFPAAPLPISIPSRYVSFLAPLSAPLLYMQARDLPHSQPLGSLQMPYVAYPYRARSLASPQPVWQFTHPPHPAPSSASLDRHAKVRFVMDGPSQGAGALVTGFVGYFYAHLYGGVGLSTVPSREGDMDVDFGEEACDGESRGGDLLEGLADMFGKTDTMDSWFPLYLPITTPMHLRPGQSLELEMWRTGSERSVHYEWSVVGVETAQQLPIHNLNGRCYAVGK
eukprot:gene32431-39217_t